MLVTKKYLDKFIPFVRIVVAVSLPFNMLVFKFLVTETQYFHSVSVKRIILVHVNYVKFDWTSFVRFDAEIKPIRVPLCVNIVLEDQFKRPILCDLALFIHFPEDCKQISALEPAIELNRTLLLRGFVLLGFFLLPLCKHMLEFRISKVANQGTTCVC